MRDFLSFEPLYQERVWGGRGLAEALGRHLPGSRPIGESWEIVDRPEAQSVVADGPLQGQTLRDLIRNEGADLMGPGWRPSRPFPLLVKWLDCRERLSLQVHPPAEIAPELGGEPKTENWYIAAAEPGAHLLVGLQPGTTRESFERALAAETVEASVRRIPVAAGDSILVRSGQVHAIDGGNLILEIQQNSDTTYRVYDWGRMGLDGKPRQMHVQESLRSICWEGDESEPVRGERRRALIADCPEFRIERVPLAAGEKLELAGGEEPRLVSIVEGSAGPWRRGANLVAPFTADVAIVASEPMVVLVTSGFAAS